ncbi:hypothetical protein Tco_0366169 [Tanacetum coccineum]
MSRATPTANLHMACFNFVFIDTSWKQSSLTMALYMLTIPGSGSSVGGSGMLDEEEIVKLLEEEEMVELELQVCGNVTDQEDLYKFDEEAFNLVLEKEARQAWAEHEWLEKCRSGQDFLFRRAKGGGALGSSGALKLSTHLVITILLYTLRAEVEAACALEAEAMGALDLVEALKVEVEAVEALDLVEGALDLVEVEASCLVGALNVVGLSLNIIISISVSGYLTSLKQTTSSSPEKPSSLDT